MEIIALLREKQHDFCWVNTNTFNPVTFLRAVEDVRHMQETTPKFFEEVSTEAKADIQGMTEKQIEARRWGDGDEKPLALLYVERENNREDSVKESPGSVPALVGPELDTIVGLVKLAIDGRGRTKRVSLELDQLRGESSGRIPTPGRGRGRGRGRGTAPAPAPDQVNWLSVEDPESMKAEIAAKKAKATALMQCWDAQTPGSSMTGPVPVPERPALQSPAAGSRHVEDPDSMMVKIAAKKAKAMAKMQYSDAQTPGSSMTGPVPVPEQHALESPAAGSRHVEDPGSMKAAIAAAKAKAMAKMQRDPTS
jgi:hypothetical protein